MNNTDTDYSSDGNPELFIPSRFNNCRFNPTSLNPVGINDSLYTPSGSDYVTEQQLQASVCKLYNEPFSIFHTNIRSI